MPWPGHLPTGAPPGPIASVPSPLIASLIPMVRLLQNFRRLQAVILVAVSSPVALAASSGGWQRLAPLPVGNGGFVSAALNGEIVIAGGTTWKDDTKSWLDQIWIYDPARNAWRDGGRLPVALAYATTGTDRSSLWFAGGSSGTSTHLVLWKMEPGGAVRRSATLERGFVYGSGAVIGSTLYTVGGSDDQSKLDHITNAFHGINLRTGALTRLPNYPEAGLSTGTAAAIGDRLYVFGGAQWDPAKATVVNHSAAHVYATNAKAWTPLPPLPHPGRGITAVTLDDRHILLAGGYRNDEVEFVRDAFIFDVQTSVYTATGPLPYAAMVALVQSGDWLYCLGGEDRKKHRTDAVHRIRWRELLRP